MADIADLAQEQQQDIVPISKYDFSKTSRTHCIDCDDDIPTDRQRLGGVTRCKDCQEIEDKRL